MHHLIDHGGEIIRWSDVGCHEIPFAAAFFGEPEVSASGFLI
jgi:hypothetical protein